MRFFDVSYWDPTLKAVMILPTPDAAMQLIVWNAVKAAGFEMMSLPPGEAEITQSDLDRWIPE